MKTVVAGALVFALAAVSAGPVQSQTSTSAAPSAPSSLEVSPPKLEEVLVTGQSLEDDLPQQLSQYGTRVDTVTSTQIVNGGFIDVTRALEQLTPGLYITSQNGPFDYVHVSLQGSRTEDVLWLVDGIRINNRLYAGTTPLDTIPASMIERIEVLDGGQALFYGTQAMAGAVNIVTKSFTDHPDGAFSLGADSDNGKHINGYFRDGIDHNDFVLYATHDESSGIQPYPTADFQPSGTERHRPYDVTTLGLKYGYNFTDALALSALYQHTNATVGFAEPMLTALAYNQRNEDLVSSRLDYVPSTGLLKFYIKDYYHRWSSYYTEYDNGSTPYSYTPGAPGQLSVASDDDFWGFKDYGANLLTELDTQSGLQYLGGYDFQGYTGRDAVLVIQQETEHVSAFFGQIRATPDLIPDAHLAAGLRYNIPSVGQSALVWNGSGQYDFSKAFFVRTTFGTAFRLPTDEELFANDPDDERGDPHLKPETSTSANLAVGGNVAAGGSTVKWEVTGFYRRIHNFIECGGFDAVTDQCLFENVPGDLRVMGQELTLQAHVTPSLSATFDITHNHSRQSGSDLQFDEVPENQVKAGLDYHPPGAWYGAGLTLVRVGDLDDEPLGMGAGRFGYGNYTDVDLNGHVFLDSDHRQRIDLHVDNVFNHVYYSGLGYGVNDVTGAAYPVHDLAMPRTFQVNYTYQFH